MLGKIDRRGALAVSPRTEHLSRSFWNGKSWATNMIMRTELEYSTGISAQAASYKVCLSKNASFALIVKVSSVHCLTNKNNYRLLALDADLSQRRSSSLP